MKTSGRKKPLSFFLIALACVLVVSCCVAEGNAVQLPADNAGGDASVDVQASLAYDEAVKNGENLSIGSLRWIPYEEALAYHPALPLPEVYKECPVQACSVALSTSSLPRDMKDGEAVKVPATPDNILRIVALYSDGVTTYRVEFNVGRIIVNSIEKQKLEAGGYLLLSRETGEIEGIGLEQDGFALNLYDGDAGDPLEVAPGVPINPYQAGTSKATEENASGLLQDPELTELFDALIDFVSP